MSATNSPTVGDVGAKRSAPSWHVELVAGFSTYLTLSYIFLLNPVLLGKAGMDPSAVLFATVISGFVATMAMGLLARLPYAVASAPTVTTFLVFYVCNTLHLTWQQALAAVFISGVISLAATALSIRDKLIAALSDELKLSIMFAIGAFIAANGLLLAKIISFDHGILAFGKLSTAALLAPSAIGLYVGFFVAVVLGIRALGFRAGPLVAIIIATIAVQRLGIPFGKPELSLDKMFSAVGMLDFNGFFGVKFWIAAIVFFLVDFYGAIGKFVGLMELTRGESGRVTADDLGKALYVDSGGTVVGALVGTSSLAVFISSAVGIIAGGRTGRTAIFCSLFMLASLAFLPFVGAIPTVATAGILFYIGFILMPWHRLWAAMSSGRHGYLHGLIAAACSLVSLLTYGVDKALFVAFCAYLVLDIAKRRGRLVSTDAYMISTVLLLGASVAAQFLLIPQ